MIWSRLMTTMARKYGGGRCSEGRVSPGLLKRSEDNRELWKVRLKTGRDESEPQEVILYPSPFLPKPTTQVVNQPFSHGSIESARVVILHVIVVNLRNRTAQHLDPSLGQAEVYHKRKSAAVTRRWRRNN